MASAAEQLAAHINFGQIGKATELKKRLWFTLGALIVYRLGIFRCPGSIPLFYLKFLQAKQGGFWQFLICLPGAHLVE